MHRVTHVHHVDAEMRYEPKRVEKKMCSCLLPPSLVVLYAWNHPKNNDGFYFILLQSSIIIWIAWSRPHITPVWVPLYDPLVASSFQMCFSCSCFNPEPHALWRFGLSMSIWYKVVLTSCKATVADARLPCQLVTCLSPNRPPRKILGERCTPSAHVRIMASRVLSAQPSRNSI